jgi:GrpB-like predicted nucleotidyltransferase (UPF0157 family)
MEPPPRRTIIVADYDPAWPAAFVALKAVIWPHVQDVALAIEHVGSTAVPGLAAKPIIDLDVVIPSSTQLPVIIERLASIGYRHEGNLGIEDRDAFATPPGAVAQHLYVCRHSSIALRNHLCLRDHLRANPADAAAYGALKRELAKAHANDIDSYIAGKREFVLAILGRYGFGADSLDAIAAANRSRGS